MKYSRVLLAIASTLALLQANQASAAPLTTLDSSIAREFVQPLLKANPALGSAVQDGFPDSFEVEVPHSSRTFTLKLQKNTELLSPDYQATVLDVDPTTNAVRESIVQPVSERPDCYYHGTVDGEQGSVVAVNLCDGTMQGFIQTNEKTYSLESASVPTLPTTSTTTPAAVLRRSVSAVLASPVVMVDVNEEESFVSSQSGTAANCGSHQLQQDNDDVDTDTTIPQQQQPEAINERTRLPNAIPNQHTSSHNKMIEDLVDKHIAAINDTTDSDNTVAAVKSVKYVEVLVFNDHKRYQSHQDDTSSNTIALMNNIAAYYRHGNFKYDVRVVLKGQVTFKGADPYHKPMKNDGSVRVMGNSGLLNQFNYYRANNLGSLIKHDLGVLFSGNTFEQNIRGLANVGAVCGHTTLSGNICQVTYRNQVMNSVLSAHELGHNLGMQHDGQGNRCSAPVHIMQPYVSTKTTWSDCSRAYFNAHMDAYTCMNNNPYAEASSAIEKDDTHNDSHNESNNNKSNNDSNNKSNNNNTKSDDDVTFDQTTVVWLCLLTAFLTALVVGAVAVVTKRQRERRQQELQQQVQQQVQQQLQQQQPSCYPVMYSPTSPTTPTAAQVQQLPPAYMPIMSPSAQAPLTHTGPVFVYPTQEQMQHLQRQQSTQA